MLRKCYACISDDLLVVDSTSIGNHYNNKLKITNNMAKYSIDEGNKFDNCPYEKKENTKVLLTTGADNTFSKMNIYDLSGNVWEWVLSKPTNTTNTCANRGGSYISGGNVRQANYQGDDIIGSKCNYTGFRVTMY